jgi:choline dehydrogenase-like flavoprotein
MGVAVARRLGGTSNLWGGRCVPYDPIDFAERPGLVGPLWPIGPGAIAPHYEAACRYANCGSPVFEQAVPGVTVDDPRFTYTRLERWSNRLRFHQAHRRTLAGNPNIELRLGSTVVDLELVAGRHVGAVIVAMRDGSRARVLARRFVLAAGGIETARLLLAVSGASRGRLAARTARWAATTWAT